MQYFLEHSDHGKKVAYSDPEYKEDLQHGWVRVTKDEYYDLSRDPAKKALLDAEQAEIDRINAEKEALLSQREELERLRKENSELTELLNESEPTAEKGDAEGVEAESQPKAGSKTTSKSGQRGKNSKAA